MCCGALGRTNPAMPVCLKMHWQTDKQTEGKQKQRSKLSTNKERLFKQKVFDYIVLKADCNLHISLHNIVKVKVFSRDENQDEIMHGLLRLHECTFLK